MRYPGVNAKRFTFLALSLNAHLLCCLVSSATVAAVETSVIDVALVWSGHPVGFCLLTHPPQQFVAYYDSDRHMTVAQRNLGDTTWTFTRLSSKVEWDSHNYITMTVDRAEYLHLAGNMHCVPLIYYRSEKPLEDVEPRVIASSRSKLEIDKGLRTLTVKDHDRHSRDGVHEAPQGKRPAKQHVQRFMPQTN